MVVLAVQAAGELAGGRAGPRVVAFVQQHQLAAAMEHRAGLRRLDLERQAGRLVRIGIVQHDQAVGLAQAELGPRCERGVGAIEHEWMVELAAREPLGILVHRIGSEHLRLAADPRQRALELDREARRRHAGPGRQQREGARLAAALDRPHDVAHRDVAHQGRQHLGMVRGEIVEARLCQAPDLAVAQRRHAARALGVRQQRHLADNVAGRDLGDQRRAAFDRVVVVVTEHAEAAAGHEIDGVGRFTLVEQGRAAGQDQRRELALDCRHAGGVEVGEEGGAQQRLPQPQPGRIPVRLDNVHRRLIGRRAP
jgi:hypothetical protein